MHNSHELDLSWQESVDLQPEDENEDGSEIYYYTDENGNIHSREFLSEEFIPDGAKDFASPQKRTSSHVKVERLKPRTTDVVNLIPAGKKTPTELVLPIPQSGTTLSISEYRQEHITCNPCYRGSQEFEWHLPA